MFGRATLENASFPIQALRNRNVKQLLSLLSKMEKGDKAIVADAGMLATLNAITSFSSLQSVGVKRIHPLAPGALETDCSIIVYLVRSGIASMRHIASHLRHHPERTRRNYVVFVPRKDVTCVRVLEEEGVYGEVTLLEYNLGFVAVDTDVLTLQVSNSFRRLFLLQDLTLLHHLCKAIMILESIYGRLRVLCGKGSLSSLLSDMLINATRPISSFDLDETQRRSSLHTMYLLDRTVDMVTPLVTQLTYEGLIDELFSIRHNAIQVPADLLITSTQKKPKKPKQEPPVEGSGERQLSKITLNSNDPLFAHIRNLNFGSIPAHLHRTAREIDSNYQERHNAHTISQIKQFVGKLQSLTKVHQALSVHSHLAERIQVVTEKSTFKDVLRAEQFLLAGSTDKKDIIEQCIDKKDPILKVLRLLCLRSLCCGGIKAKQLQMYKEKVYQAYGYEHMITMYNLERMELLQLPSQSHTSFSRLRRQFSLIVDDVQLDPPSDCAYTYSGYAPLSVRMLERRMRWSSSDTLKAIKGTYFEHLMTVNGTLLSSRVDAKRSVVRKGSALAVLMKSQERVMLSDQQSPSAGDASSSPSHANGAASPSTSKPSSFEKGTPASASSSSSGSRKRSKKQQPTEGDDDVPILILFLGGVTFSEISALRYMSRREQRPILILTTSIITGDALMSDLLHL